MIRVACNLPLKTDATSWWRGAGPLAVLQKQNRQLDFDWSISAWSWPEMKKYDVLFVQRPFKPDHVSLIQMAKSYGLPVWVDYDDFLFAIPTDNPTHGMYIRDELQEAVKKCLAMADYLTFSTKHLETLYRPYFKCQSEVLPNAWDFLHDTRQRRQGLPERQPLVTWRGSNTHTRDLMAYAREITMVQNRASLSRYLFQYLGYNPWFITDHTPHERTIWAEPMDPKVYLEHLFVTAPVLMQVPLAYSDFNLSKSNIAWMEAAYAGAASLVPNWPEWKVPGALNYGSPAEYHDLLVASLEGGIDLAKSAALSWEYVEDVLDVRKVNKVRETIIEKLRNA